MDVEELMRFAESVGVELLGAGTAEEILNRLLEGATAAENI